MKRPSFQFYPADWRNASNLRRCTLAARGAWVDILCILHDSDTYGLVHWTLKELASAAGVPMAQVRELVAKGVLKGCDAGQCEPYVYRPKSGRREGPPVTLVPEQPGPVWFSSRMVKDEYVRQVRGGDTRFGDDDDASNAAPKAGGKPAPKPSPNPPLGDGSTSSSTSSPSGEIPSDADASAAAAAPPMPDDVDVIWSHGLAMLMAAKVPEERARAFLGRLRSCNTDADIAAAIARCARQTAIDPVSYLQGCLRLTKANAAARDATPATFRERSEAAAKRQADAWMPTIAAARDRGTVTVEAVDADPPRLAAR